MWKRFSETSLTEKGCLALGLLLTVWYAWIMDDAYIYFRYVDNLVVHGLGLVYNEGEFVEGFSSPGWAFLLIVLRFLHLNYWLIVRLVGVLSFIIFWYLAVRINRELSHHKENDLVINLPLIYLTFTYGVLCYFTSGLEAPLVMIAAAAFAALFVFPDDKRLHFLVGLAPFIRAELTLPFLIALAWLWIRKKRFPTILFITCAMTMGLYELFRIWYYADLFPNTFYLKDEIWVTQGLAYLYDTLIAYYTVPLLSLFAVLYFILRKRDGASFVSEEARFMMVLSALPVLAYVIKIGGDARHFRYLAFPFCLFVFSTGGLIETVVEPIGRKYRRQILVMAAFAALMFLSFYPRQLLQHPIFRLRLGQEHTELFKINDAVVHRFNSNGITPPLTSLAPERLSYAAAERRYEEMKKELIMEHACEIGYYKPKARVVHLAGLTEPFLARASVKSTRAGHKKGLIPLSADLMRLRRKYGFRRGAFADAMAEGNAPRWVVDNLPALALIENKSYNRHSFIDNLKTSLSGSARIDITSKGWQDKDWRDLLDDARKTLEVTSN